MKIILDVSDPNFWTEENRKLLKEKYKLDTSENGVYGNLNILTNGHCPLKGIGQYLKNVRLGGSYNSHCNLDILTNDLSKRIKILNILK